MLGNTSSNTQFITYQPIDVDQASGRMLTSRNMKNLPLNANKSDPSLSRGRKDEDVLAEGGYFRACTCARDLRCCQGLVSDDQG